LPKRGGAWRSGDCRACQVRAWSICSALSDEELAALELVQRRREISRGQALFFEGDAAEQVYILTGGTVRLTKMTPDGRRQITGFRIAGDLIGLAHRGSYHYTAEAIDAVSACRIGQRAFGQLCERFPGLQRRLLRHVCDELAQAQEQMLSLGRRSVRERLVILLLSLRGRIAEHGHADSAIHLPMRRSDIADFIGTTVETVSRILTRLRKEGLIELPRSDLIVVKNDEAMEDIAA
ncbi:MAG TPA: Crp/Fnr family transcriptional regulator, partial [Woeseiaceae bacterium]|nr:Crp/Fnr family transcriptional regulator [Woeseiaceae bacterium]